MRYQFLPAMLLNEYPRQQRTIEAQAIHIAKLERETARIATLEAQVGQLNAAAAEVGEMKQQMAHLARLLDQRRAGAVIAGLGFD